jgi:hypothetical protein
MLRRFAFKYSESSYGHWLPLMLADRVGVVEGVLDDLSHGHVPTFQRAGRESGVEAQPKKPGDGGSRGGGSCFRRRRLRAQRKG